MVLLTDAKRIRLSAREVRLDMIGVRAGSVASFVVIGVAALLGILATSCQAPTRQPEETPATTVSEEVRPSPGLPEDCLVAGVLTDARALCRLAGELLVAVDGKSDADRLLRRIGERLQNPTLAGVDLSSPIRFFYMNPRKYQGPWVYQFAVSDPAALKRAMARRSKETARLSVSMKGNQATAFLDALAGKDLMRSLETHPAELVFNTRGRLRLRMNVPLTLRVYQRELTHQIEEMKWRMRWAVNRAPSQAGAELEIAQWHQDLNAILLLLGQVRETECGIEPALDFAAFHIRVEPFPGSALAAFVAAHPQGSQALLRRCPSDATLLVTHNIMIADAVRNLILRTLDLRKLVAVREPVKPSGGHAAFALLPSPAPGSRFEALELRSGATAKMALNRWKRFAEPLAETASQPILLRPIKSEQQLPEGLRIAEVIPNEEALGASGVNAIRFLFGRRTRAALELGDEGSVLVVGRNPLTRIRQIRELAKDKGASLRLDEAFVRSLELLPDNPNLLAYVSPRGIRQWLMLAGVSPDTLSPIRTGVAVGLKASPDGVLIGSLRLPTRPIREAALSQRSSPPRGGLVPDPRPKQ